MCTVYSIKTEMFYGRSTSTGTGVVLFRFYRIYRMLCSRTANHAMLSALHTLCGPTLY